MDCMSSPSLTLTIHAILVALDVIDIFTWEVFEYKIWRRRFLSYVVE